MCKSNLVVKIDEHDAELENLRSGVKDLIVGSPVKNFQNAMPPTSNVNVNPESSENSGPAVSVVQSKLSASPSQCSIGKSRLFLAWLNS